MLGPGHWFIEEHRHIVCPVPGMLATPPTQRSPELSGKQKAQTASLGRHTFAEMGSNDIDDDVCADEAHARLLVAIHPA